MKREATISSLVLFSLSVPLLSVHRANDHVYTSFGRFESSHRHICTHHPLLLVRLRDAPQGLAYPVTKTSRTAIAVVVVVVVAVREKRENFETLDPVFLTDVRSIIFRSSK